MADSHDSFYTGSTGNGRFGQHGGQYIPETLLNAVIELEKAYNHYKADPEFNKELNTLLNEYANRPSRLYFAKKMTEDLGGAKIYLKREDLNHTGAHKINNVLGQALLAKRWERQGSSLRQEQASMELRLRRQQLSWEWNVLCSWVRRTPKDRRSMYTE